MMMAGDELFGELPEQGKSDSGSGMEAQQSQD